MKAHWLFGTALAALFTAFAAEAGIASSSYTNVDAAVTNDVQVAPDAPAVVPRTRDEERADVTTQSAPVSPPAVRAAPAATDQETETETEHENETENETESERESETESEREHEGASRLDNARRPSMIDLDGGHDH